MERGLLLSTATERDPAQNCTARMHQLCSRKSLAVLAWHGVQDAELTKVG